MFLLFLLVSLVFKTLVLHFFTIIFKYKNKHILNAFYVVLITYFVIALLSLISEESLFLYVFNFLSVLLLVKYFYKESLQKLFTVVFVYLLSVFLVIQFINSFLVSGFTQGGASMEPFIQNGETFYLEKITHEYGFGDIVLFLEPVKGSLVVKRIIGMPGDVIEIKDGKVLRNEELLIEDYLNDKSLNHTFIPMPIQYQKYEVPKDAYFVLGDNRNASADSRSYGLKGSAFIKKDKIQGRYFLSLF